MEKEENKLNKMDDFDMLIQESIIEEINSIVVPDMEDIWDNINEDIVNINKQKRFNFNKRITSIVASILILTVILTNVDSGHAYYRKILNFFSKTIGTSNDIKLNYSNNTRTTPGIDEDIKIDLETLPIEEAIPKASFKIITPTYIPKGYVVENVKLTQFGDKTLMAEIIYSNHNDDLIKIIQEPVVGDYSHSLQVDSNESTIRQETFDNIEYNIIEFKNGEAMVIWDMLQIKYTIVGINEKELINIALSIK